MSIEVQRSTFNVQRSKSTGQSPTLHLEPGTWNKGGGQVLFDTNRRIHFVGIGGVGMSGIAGGVVQLGYTVRGSDLTGAGATPRLAAVGAPIAYCPPAAEGTPANAVV